MEKNFKILIMSKAFILLLIIIWGGYQSITSPVKSAVSVTDVGGLAFLFFSIAYFINSYLLYHLKVLGKKTYLPLVLTFILIGFFGELISPMQVNKDLFYLLIFYIISPIFFIAQGVTLAMILFSSLKGEFS